MKKQRNEKTNYVELNEVIDLKDSNNKNNIDELDINQDINQDNKIEEEVVLEQSSVVEETEYDKEAKNKTTMNFLSEDDVNKIIDILKKVNVDENFISIIKALIKKINIFEPKTDIEFSKLSSKTLNKIKEELDKKFNVSVKATDIISGSLIPTFNAIEREYEKKKSKTTAIAKTPEQKRELKQALINIGGISINGTKVVLKTLRDLIPNIEVNYRDLKGIDYISQIDSFDDFYDGTNFNFLLPAINEISTQTHLYNDSLNFLNASLSSWKMMTKFVEYLLLGISLVMLGLIETPVDFKDFYDKLWNFIRAHEIALQKRHSISLEKIELFEEIK